MGAEGIITFTQMSLRADKYLQPALLIASGITMVGIIIQATSMKALYIFASIRTTKQMLTVRRTQLYLGRLIAGFGVGAASMLTPLYVSFCPARRIEPELKCDS
jgi:hypothetical protein